MASRKKREPIHPGEILNEKFLKPMDISQSRLAGDIGVSPRRINEVVHGKRGISANTALRLALYFGTSAEFWMNLQSRFDLEVERDRSEKELAKQVRAVAAA
jgi:antitoxin HigA-1